MIFAAGSRIAAIPSLPFENRCICRALDATRLSSPKIPTPYRHNSGAAGALILLTVP